MNKKELFEACLKARELSYSPYSKFAVGSVILLKNGDIINGANIENSAYGLSLCAERNAIFQMHLKGHNKEDVECIAIIADTDEPVSPCGSCRQVMAELLSSDIKVILFNLKGDSKETTVEELLPFSFGPKDLK